MSETTNSAYPPLAEESIRHINIKILVINHNRDALESNSFILRQAGYGVLTAQDGLTGLEIARKELPDLIISDVSAPGLDGIELCRRLRADSRLKEIPVILLSDLDPDAASAGKASEAGADDYIEAPFEPVRLIAGVSHLVERKRAEQERNRFFGVSVDLLCIAGLDGFYKQLNPAWEKTLGFTPEELMQQPFIEFVHPEDREKTRASLADLEKGKPTSQFENRYLCKDGSYKFLSWNATPADENHLIYAVARDITQARADERILNESKEQITNILESLTDGFFALDGNWNFTYLNPATEYLWQRSAEELLGKNFWQEFPAALDTAFYGKYREVMEKRIPLRFTEFYPDRNLWLDVQASPAKDGISVYFRDATKLKTAEQEKARLTSQIEQQHHRLNNIIANVPGIVWETWIKPDEPLGQINFISDYVEKMLGYTVDEWLADPGFWLTVIYPEDREKALQQVAGNFKGNRTSAFEVRLVSKDGRIVWTELQTQTITNSENKVIGVRGVTTDITARKEAETALAEANKRAISEYERLLQGLAALAQALGAARDLNGVFRSIQEFTRVSVPCDAILLSLCEQEQKMRKIVYIWYNDEELDTSVFEAVPVGGGAAGTAIKTGEVVIIPDYLEHIRRKGIKLSFGYEEDSRDPRSSLIVPMKIKGSTVGVIEIQSYELAAYLKEHAVTMQMAANLAANAVENVRLLEQERKQEEQLRQSQKLESVGRLAGGIAHDFNNMLTAINGYSELTLRKLNAADPLRRNLEEIKKAGERSAVLTQQLLAFSRQQVLKPTVLNVNEVIIDISKMLNRLIGEDIQLNIVPESNLGFVEADSGQLTQVIMNLVVNARDAMPDGGIITVKTSNVFLDSEYVKSHIDTRAGSYILLEVSDTGFGMSDEIKEQIFEPFFTTKKPGEGTGLGLSTTYGIVNQSGGYISVDSEIDQGTTFYIYFPRFDKEIARPVENKTSRVIKTGTETILLVEDEELVRNMSRQILEACGYHVIEAQNGVEAISVCAARNEKIELLLTDVVMPQMGGRELAEKLSEIHPEIRVLFASGYTDDAVIRQGIVRENMNFIQKPFTFDALAQKVREILDDTD